MNIKHFMLVAVAGLTVGCSQPAKQEVLPSWNDTPVKAKILNYMNTEVDKIPVANRIAVFDMDGTLVTERPLSIELVVSVQRMLDRAEKEPELRDCIEYQYAKRLSVNPHDTLVHNHPMVDGKYVLQSMLMKAFEGAESEEYISYTNKALNTLKNSDYNMVYADMFYQPMLELVDLLKEKQFEVYIVSAAMQGIVWSICPQIIGAERDHLIGIRHAKEVTFQKGGPIYTLKAEMVEPINNHIGKAINIYDHIGKVPVVAVGNTSSDFGMFHMASCNNYPHLSLMVNHDDAEREYAYSPSHVKGMNWQDTLRINGWLQADMSKEFGHLWMKK